jgi:hypothetical protein
MIPAFSKLIGGEIDLMLRAPLTACILIAGADGHIDRKEIRKALAVARKKASGGSVQLVEFFRNVETDFEDKLKIVYQELPTEVNERNGLIAQELADLNAILAKVDKSFAIEFYNSLKYLASQIAASSGGVLGINSVGEEEARYVGLPMLKNPAS